MNEHTMMRQFDILGTNFSLIDPGDTVKAETFSDAGYEPAVVTLLDQIYARKPNAQFCDIGALHGYYSALVSHRYPSWIVHAFEPNPDAYGVLSKNFSDNTIRGTIHQVALNETGDNLYFKGRTLVDPSTGGAIIVPGVTFDKFSADNNLSDVVAKIDVHGAEALVLSGMQHSLSGVVTDVLIEIHAQHLLIGSKTYEDILGLLEDAQLSVYEVDHFRYNTSVELVPLKGDRRKQFVQFSLWTDEQMSRERLIYARGEI